jgi:transcriptional regulator with XRE-family HTH domain
MKTRESPPPVGVLLKEWRRMRGKSQLALAVEANASPRYLSFVESGRARPSREFLHTLAEALHIPLREQNVLLSAAGFAPMHPETPLAASDLGPLRSALTRLLSLQEPYPAVLLDRQWNVVETNRSAPRLFSRFVDLTRIPEPRNLLRTMFSPTGMRPWIENWDEVAESLAQRVFREAVAGVPDQRTLALLAELQGGSFAPRGLGSGNRLPFHPVIFRKDELRLAFFSMITSVGSPLDVTAQELRIEAFFPADPATEAFATEQLAKD